MDQTGLNFIGFLPASTGDEQHQLRPGSWVETVILNRDQLFLWYSLHKSSREKKMEGRIQVGVRLAKERQIKWERKEIRRKADVQESSQRAEVDISVWRLKIFQSTPGIEPRTFSYVCQHTTHTPPPRPFLNFKVENNIALMLVICFELPFPEKC